MCTLASWMWYYYDFLSVFSYTAFSKTYWKVIFNIHLHTSRKVTNHLRPPPSQALIACGKSGLAHAWFSVQSALALAAVSCFRDILIAGSNLGRYRFKIALAPEHEPNPMFGTGNSELTQTEPNTNLALKSQGYLNNSSNMVCPIDQLL